MPDDNDRNPNDPEELAAILAENRRQMRLAEEAIRGLTTQFGSGGGQFVGGEYDEQVRLADPVMPLPPEDVRNIEAALSVIDVSGNRDVGTEIEVPEVDPIQAVEDVPEESDPPSEVHIEPIAVDEPRAEEEIPPEVQHSEPPTMPPVEPQADQPVSAPMQVGSEFSGPMVGARAFEASRRTPEQKAKVLREAVKEVTRFRAKERGEQSSVEDAEPTREPPKAASGTTEQSSPTRSERAPSPERSPAPTPAPPVAGFEGFVGPDQGQAGTTFYQDPTAGQVELVQTASDAVDAVGNVTELVMELLRNLTQNMLRHEEFLSNALDKTEAEDETDEF